MRKFASNDLPTVRVDKKQPNTQSNTDRALAVIGTSIVCVSFFFMVFPLADLAVSRWFAEGQVFVLAEQPFLLALRGLSREVTRYIIWAMVLLIGLRTVAPKRYRFCPPHKPLFVLMSFAAGPGLVVEILKVLIGRARPRDLLEFGGSADFTPVWQFSVACSRNCSFPSGEAAAAAAALSLLVLVPVKLRGGAAIMLTPCLVFIAFNRVLFGAHFLSDVVIGGLLTMLAMAWVWRWIEARSKQIDKLFTPAFFFGRTPATYDQPRKVVP